MKRAMLFAAILIAMAIIPLAVNAGDDVSIDANGNVTTGSSNSNSNFEVTGGSGEDAIVGSASGTGASGVYGINSTYGDYGILGDYGIGVYGNSSNWAGYFEGSVHVTGNLSVAGTFSGYTETDPVFSASPSYGITSGMITNWNTAYGWGDHASAGYLTGETDPQVGSNTTNYVPKWNGSALVTGTIFDSGNIGIGTTTPSSMLDVSGDINSSAHYMMQGQRMLSADGTDNILLGRTAGLNNTGSYNSFIGHSTGISSSGSYNTALGRSAGWGLTSGEKNTFVGASAGQNSNSGDDNTFVGYYSGQNNNSGLSNTFLGSNAGRANTGNGNIFIGSYTGITNTSGGNNTYLGRTAGYFSNGSGNVFLGFAAGHDETGSNKLYIDNSGTATPLIYGEFDNNILVINGSLGINAVPSYPFDVAGHARVLGPYGFDSAGETAITYYGDAAHYVKGTYAGGMNLNSSNAASDPITFSFGGSEKMRITNTGNVGIGTSAPTYKLDVAGALNLNKGIASGAALNVNDTEAIWFDGTYFSWGYGGSKNYFQDKVGIGTTNPQGMLDVNGAIYQRGSQLHADYVFEPDYKLESIEEHAEFMWENKHLRAVPKAMVDENGLEIVEVGSHQKGIVEELEKAHIYIEQLQKKIKSLEERNIHLNNLEERLAKLEARGNIDK